MHVEMLIRKHDDVTAIFYSKARRGEARLVEDLEVQFYSLYEFKFCTTLFDMLAKTLCKYNCVCFTATA
jgi:hypothetical protein